MLTRLDTIYGVYIYIYINGDVTPSSTCYINRAIDC